MYILIKKSGWLKQKYHFCIMASNGNVMCSSEKYYNLQDCEDSAIAVRSRNNWLIKFDWD